MTLLTTTQTVDGLACGSRARGGGVSVVVGGRQETESEEN
jgi:hypothetical protein